MVGGNRYGGILIPVLKLPETWPDDYEIQGFTFSPLFGHLSVMQEVTEQLGGRTIFYRRWRLTHYQMAESRRRVDDAQVRTY